MGKTLQKNIIDAIVNQYSETKDESDFDIEVFLTADNLESIIEKASKEVKIKGPKPAPKANADLASFNPLITLVRSFNVEWKRSILFMWSFLVNGLDCLCAFGDCRKT